MDDEKIIDLLFARDEQGLREAETKYGSYCRYIAYNILQNDEDCAECLNDLWLRLWNAVPPQKPDDLKLFLASVVRNLAFDRYKEQRRRKRGGEHPIEALEEIEDFVTGEASVDEAVEQKELARVIDRFLLSLSARERGVFVRRYYFVDDTKCIAKRYGMRSAAVLTMLSRTRKKLKEYLKTEGYDL